jgi:hypothetical protein
LHYYTAFWLLPVILLFWFDLSSYVDGSIFQEELIDETDFFKKIIAYQDKMNLEDI